MFLFFLITFKPNFHRKFLVSSETTNIAILPPLLLSAGLILLPAYLE